MDALIIFQRRRSYLVNGNQSLMLQVIGAFRQSYLLRGQCNDATEV